MLHAAAHRALDQAARLGRVVEIVAERIGDRFRHDDLGAKWAIASIAMLGDDARRPAPCRRCRRPRAWRLPGTAQAKPVDRLSRTTTFRRRQQAEHHVAADIAGAARSPEPLICLSLFELDRVIAARSRIESASRSLMTGTRH